MSYAALPVLRTPRLTLRPLEQSDSDAVVAGIGNYDVSRWLGRVPYPYGAEDYAEFFTRVRDQEMMIWGIVHEGDLIGVVGLDEELGYWLARPVWGQGFGYEAAQAAVAHWFSKRGRGDLPSGHFDENDRSRRVLTSLGFRPVGQGLRYAKSLAQPVAGTDVALTRKAWAARMDFRIRTDRLLLRPMEPRDAKSFAALTVERVARNTQLKPDMTLGEAKDQVARRAWRGYLGFSLAIEYRRRMVGFIGAGGTPASVGYALDPALWGQGLMSEALPFFCKAVFARFPITRLTADHFEDNPASGAVLRRAGFETTGFDHGTSPARVEPAALITYALRRENMRLCHEIP